MIKKANYMTVHDLVELLRWNINQGNISPDAPVVEHMGRYYREVISVWVEGHGHTETIHLGTQTPDPQCRVLEHESQQEGFSNDTTKD